MDCIGTLLKKRENNLKLKTMPDITGQAVDFGLGMLTNAADRVFQIGQQQRLTNQQVKAMKQMGQFNYEKQMQLWRETNYPAQVGMMKEAGLNPALMYKGSGAGGTTTFMGGGGVTGGTAGGMELGNAVMQRAQIRLMESQANKLDVEAKKTAGVDTKLAETQIADLTQGIENQKAVEELTKIQTSIAEIENEIKGYTQNAAKALILTELHSATFIMNSLEAQKDIDQATKDNKIKMVEAELAGIWAKNELAKSSVKLNEAQMANMVNQIKLAYDQLANETDKTAIQKRLAEFETSFGKQIGGILGDVLQILPIGRGKGKTNKTIIEHTGGAHNTTTHKRE